MVDLVRVNGSSTVGLPLQLADGSVYVVPAVVQISAAGAEVAGGASGLIVGPDGKVSVAQPDAINSQQLDLSTQDASIAIPIANGQGTFGVDVKGLTGSGATLVCEMRIGDTWRPSNMLVSGTNGALSASVSVDAQFRSSAAAKWAARIRVSVPGTGTATVSWSLSTNSSVIQLTAPLPPGTNAIGAVTLSGTAQVAGTVTANIAGTPTVNANVTFPASQAVTGTFWQATQPISGSVSITGTPTVSVAGTVPVSGTFWQATQPVSLASPVNVTDNNGSLTTDTPQLPASLGIKPSATSLPVVLASDSPALPVLDRSSTSVVFSQVAVQQTPVRLLVARPTRQEATIAPLSSSTYYLGASSAMTTTSGSLPLAGVGYTHDAQTELWAIAGSGTITFGLADEFN